MQNKNWEKIERDFDNTLIDWNSPRHLAENKTVDDVKDFFKKQFQNQRQEFVSKEQVIIFLLDVMF